MTGELDLTEAVEAAARLLHPGVFTRNAPNVQADCLDDARPLVSRIAPLIAAQVRKQIAAELLATRDRHMNEVPLGVGSAPADRWALTYDYAAKIARGESA